MKKAPAMNLWLWVQKLLLFFTLLLMGCSQVYASVGKIEIEQKQLLQETDRLLKTVEENILSILSEEEKEVEHENRIKVEVAIGSVSNDSQHLKERKTVEAKRIYLDEKIKKWRRYNAESIDALTTKELNNVMSEAQSIAEYYGLDVEKLSKLFELGKKSIKNSEFVIPERIPPDKDESYSSYFRNFFTFAHNREKELAEFRAKTQKYRVRLFKKVTLAYISALLSSGEKLPECKTDKAIKTLIVDGTTLKSLNCPDPVVNNLRRYVKAIQSIASTESDLFVAEAELILVKQTLVGDMAAGLPLVGDAIDWYSLYSGQDLAGNCLSRFSYGITAVFAAIPFLPKSWGEQLLKRGGDAITNVAGKVAGFSEAFLKRNPTIDKGLSRLLVWASSSSRWSSKMMQGFAKRVGINSEMLEKTAKTLTLDNIERVLTADVRVSRKGIELDLRPVLGGKVTKSSQARVTRELSSEEIVYKNIQMAEEGQLITRNLPKELREQMETTSRRIMNANLDAVQGSRNQIIKASNMVPEHIAEFEKLAREKDAILIFRAVNGDATNLIKANYGTKWMDVKPKSSDWGPHRGFLPFEQRFSKIKNPEILAGKTQDEIVKATEKAIKYSRLAEECLTKKGCYKMDLVLPNGNSVHIWKNGDNEIPIIRNKAGQYLDPKSGRVLDVSAGSVRPMEVMAGKNAKGEIVPLTADYDLAALGTRSDVRSPEYSNETGYISAEEEMLVDEINEAGKRVGYTGGNLSHHGPENRYYASPGALAEDPVMTVIDPQKGLITIPRCDSKCMRKWCDTEGIDLCGGIPLCTMQNTKMPCIFIDPDRLLKDYMHDARLRGYTNLHPNSVWGWGEYNGLSGWTPKVLLDSQEVIDDSGKNVIQKTFGQYRPERGVVNINKKIGLKGAAKAAALKATKYLFSCPGEVQNR